MSYLVWTLFVLQQQCAQARQQKERRGGSIHEEEEGACLEDDEEDVARWRRRGRTDGGLPNDEKRARRAKKKKKTELGPKEEQRGSLSKTTNDPKNKRSSEIVGLLEEGSELVVEDVVGFAGEGVVVAAAGEGDEGGVGEEGRESLGVGEGDDFVVDAVQDEDGELFLGGARRQQTDGELFRVEGVGDEEIGLGYERKERFAHVRNRRERREHHELRRQVPRRQGRCDRSADALTEGADSVGADVLLPEQKIDRSLGGPDHRLLRRLSLTGQRVARILHRQETDAHPRR
mmetsp:Transcript_18589/g.57142  ORF Transcript_18589/g.57142 Transcript_18589/m.57142 type:complete len:289 (+) Transcript_18589:755-1621(+)